MKRAILYAAISVDGFIVNGDGGIGRLGGQHGLHGRLPGHPHPSADIGTVVMGYDTYHRIATQLLPGEWPYSGMETYVLAPHEIADAGSFHFVCEPAERLILSLRRKVDKDIWICGGADVVQRCIRYHLADLYHLSVVPVILGSGMALFGSMEASIPLRLLSSYVENGAIECIYERT